MTITITGGKYPLAAVSAVGTTTVVVVGTPFVAADFAVPRRVDLFAATTGNNAVTNGEFVTDAAWTKGPGVTISGGVTNCSNAAFVLAQSTSLVSGKRYRCSFNYTMSAGLNLRVGNSLDGSSSIVNISPLSASGSINFVFTASSPNISIGADGAVFTGTIDNFQLVLGERKGTAFVRECQSTSQLQLETEFFDPKTGVFVTQVVGDEVLVSKNFADVLQTGISASNGVVTITDNLTFGTPGLPHSLAFHDEDVTVVNTITAQEGICYSVAGGFLTFGHLQSYANKAWYGGVNFIFSAPGSINSFISVNPESRLWLIGGSHKGGGGGPCYLGAGRASSKSAGGDWGQFWLLDVKLNATDLTSAKQGGDWTTPGNHVAENCSYTGSGLAQIMVRFGNGIVIGGQYKITNNSDAPIAVFGSDAVGTFDIGAPAGLRSVVLDIGRNVLWRSGTAVTQTLIFTNLVSPNYVAGISSNPETTFNASATKRLYFLDPYTNLLGDSGLAAIRDADWTADDAQNATAPTATLRVYHSTGSGATLGVPRGPWTYRIRKYGYDEIEGVIAESSYPLGAAGTAFNVAFGGAVNQVARLSLSTPVATALAYTGITVTDHGTSPVTWQSKQWSISVTVDLATYPTRTASQVFAHIKAGIAKTATWNGRVGLLWHVLIEQEGSSGYISQRGKSGGQGAVLKGVRVIDQLGNPLPGVTSMSADDGTTYTPPVAVVLTVAANVSLVGAEIRIYDLDNSPAGSLGTELGGTESCGDATFPYVGAAGNTLWVQIMAPGYEEFGQSLVMPSASAGFIATLQSDASA